MKVFRDDESLHNLNNLRYARIIEECADGRDPFIALNYGDIEEEPFILPPRDVLGFADRLAWCVRTLDRIQQIMEQS